MQRLTVKQITTTASLVNRKGQVEVCGWLRTKRSGKKFAFLVINDGSAQASLQVVVDKNTSGHETLAQLATGAAVRVRGEIKESQGQQAIEVLAQEIELIGNADNYPLQKKGHTLEFLREISHLRARTNTFGAVFRVKHTASLATHEFFADAGFYWLHTPIITPNDCEGAGDLFTVSASAADGDGAKDFFAKPAYLTVSGQLQAEAAALALGKVYTFGPTFRAENSNTTRHLAEFWMIEPEIAFADLGMICDLAESFIKFVTVRVLTECAAELEFLQKHYGTMKLADLEKLTTTTCKRITYTEAIAILQDASGQKFVFPPEWGNDLQTEHEKYLAGEVFAGPIIITDYPQKIKPFYARQNSDGKTAAAMDLLLPGIGELIGGTQREERYDILAARTVDLQHDMQWYLDLRRFGSAPHAGWGLGFERLVQYLTGMQNIRDVVFSPRAPQLMPF